MSIYNNLFIYIDGQLLAENVTLETRIERRSDAVFSLTGNYVGEDLGPAVRIIDATNVVPRIGVEYPFEERLLSGTKVEVALVEPNRGDECYSFGRFTSVGRSSGVGQNYIVSFSFRGTPSHFK